MHEKIIFNMPLRFKIMNFIILSMVQIFFLFNFAIVRNK